MGRNHPLGCGVDSNGMMSRELDDHINSKIYSMMGTCTNEEMLKYELAIAHKSVLLLQYEIANLKGKLEALVSKHKNEVDELQSQLEMQTIKYKKAKDEACLNARALKRCIADHQQLREEIQRDMPAESSVEQGNQKMQEFGEETQTSIPTELSPNKKCQMQEFREELEISTPTELSPKQRCQPMDELRPVKYPKYQLSQDTHKFFGNHMRNIYVDCMRTMEVVHGTSEGHEDETCLNGRALKRCIADHQQLKEEIQRDMPAESSVEQGNQMQEFGEETQTRIPTELSPNKKCQMQEFREEMEISTPTELSPKQRCQDGERQYKWVDGRQSTKKRLLQELDPNIDDLSYRLSMPEDADEV